MADENENEGEASQEDIDALLNDMDNPPSTTEPAKDESTIPYEEVGDGLDAQEVAKDVEAIYDIPVQISAVLGKSTMQVNQLLKLGRGAVVELDRKVGEAIDIYVNNRLVARGEVVVVEDRLGVTMTEIVKSDRSNKN